MYGEDSKIRFQFGREIKATDYLKARRIRNNFVQQTLEIMKSVDVLIDPTNSRPPFTIGSVPPEKAIHNMVEVG